MRASEIIGAWNIIRENNHGHAMIEMDGMYYIVFCDDYSHQFRSTLPCDMPDGGGCWVSHFTDGGLRYVASGRSRAAANAQWRKHIIPRTKMLDVEKILYS